MDDISNVMTELEEIKNSIAIIDSSIDILATNMAELVNKLDSFKIVQAKKTGMVGLR